MKIQKIVNEIINDNHLFEFGLQNRIFNLTQLSRLLKPLVSQRLGRTVEISAIKMSLSRLQTKINLNTVPNKLRVDDISIKNDLISITYYKTKDNQFNISRFQDYCIQNNHFFIRSDSLKEIGICFNICVLDDLNKYIFEKPKHIEKDIAALIVGLPPEYINLKGVFQYFVQKLTLQNINIIEIASTYQELIFFLKDKDIALGMKTFLDI